MLSSLTRPFQAASNPIPLSTPTPPSTTHTTTCTGFPSQTIYPYTLHPIPTLPPPPPTPITDNIPLHFTPHPYTTTTTTTTYTTYTTSHHTASAATSDTATCTGFPSQTPANTNRKWFKLLRTLATWIFPLEVTKPSPLSSSLLLSPPLSPFISSL